MHARSSGPVKRGLRPAVGAEASGGRYSTTKSTFDGVASASTTPVGSLSRARWRLVGATELGIGDRPAVPGDECLGVGEFDAAAGDLGEHPDPYSSMKVFSALPATTCLRILPVALRSGSVRISQCAGTLWEARVAPTNAASSSVVISASSKGTT